MKKALYIFLSVLLFMLAVYTFWSNYDKVASAENIYPRYVISNVEEIGKNAGKGNIVALSPYLHTYDFSSEEAFYKMLHYYFSFAQRRKLFNDSTVVVLPEYLGTWLVVANEKRSIYADTSLEEGMKTLVFSNLGKFGLSFMQSKETDKRKEALFRMKAEMMRDIYQNTFSKLAKEFRITIVAGSIVLPQPAATNGKIELNTSGKLYNITAVFDKEGKVQAPLTEKFFPIEAEKSFTCHADKKEIPVYKTAAGNLAVLICADAWYPESYEHLKAKNIDILAVPSFTSKNGAWNEPWKGYDGAAMPADVDKSDVGKIREQDAWLKYAMTGRIKSANIKTGVNVFLRGDFWNLGSDGHTLIWNNGAPVESAKIKDKTGSLINVWLE